MTHIHAGILYCFAVFLLVVLLALTTSMSISRGESTRSGICCCGVNPTGDGPTTAVANEAVCVPATDRDMCEGGDACPDNVSLIIDARFIAGTSCSSPMPCGAATCCCSRFFPNGYFAFNDTCVEDNGTLFEGACASTTCHGYCCLGDATAELVTSEYECRRSGGAWQGYASRLSDEPIACLTAARGACCFTSQGARFCFNNARQGDCVPVGTQIVDPSFAAAESCATTSCPNAVTTNTCCRNANVFPGACTRGLTAAQCVDGSVGGDAYTSGETCQPSGECSL